MTPLQQAALEGLVGRSLSAEDIAALDPLLGADDRNDVAITAHLSVGRTKLSSLPKAVFQRWAARTGVRAVIEDHALNVNSPLRAIALTLRDVLVSDIPAIDFSLADNVALLQAWVTATAVTQAQADEVLELATVPDPLDIGEVSRALNTAEGRMMFGSPGGEL